jgi:hypothetical protein
VPGLVAKTSGSIVSLPSTIALERRGVTPPPDEVRGLVDHEVLEFSTEPRISRTAGTTGVDLYEQALPIPNRFLVSGI